VELVVRVVRAVAVAGQAAAGVGQGVKVARVARGGSWGTLGTGDSVMEVAGLSQAGRASRPV
jgi:hypothetical protein